jgi:hypothetical protein
MRFDVQVTFRYWNDGRLLRIALFLIAGKPDFSTSNSHAR